MNKQITIKVYSPTLDLMKDWTNLAVFTGFSKEINSGLSECIFKLGVPFDYQGIELAEGNIVDILVCDKDTTSKGFQKIYSGYISFVETFINSEDEGINITVLGHYTKLSTDFLKNSTQITLYSDTTSGLTTTASGSSADLGLIARAIIDRYRLETTNPLISYNSISLPLLSQSVLYTVRLKTYREALDKIISMYPQDYYYYIDEEGILSIKQKPTTPTHTFEFKKHFESIRIQRSIETLRNFLIIWNGEPSGATCVFKNYQDTLSIQKFGRRADYIKDTGLSATDIATADKIANKYLIEHKDIQIKVFCEIIDNNLDSVNGYDIESIQPGDSCRFIGFNQSLVDIINDNMMITKIDYTPEKVLLTIEPRRLSIIDSQVNTQKEVNDLSSDGVPSIYTT